MALGNILRGAAGYVDRATEQAVKAANGLKDKATGLAGDEKDSVVFDGAVEMVRDQLIMANLLTPDVQGVLKKVQASNPYAD